MIIVTGGAGFIGSALVWGLNRRGEKNIIIVDTVDHPEKKSNLTPLAYEKIIDPETFQQQMRAGLINSWDIQAVFHMGAISDTSAHDWSQLQNVNVEYSKDVITWCVENNVRMIYASSASVYGSGTFGYSDDEDLFDQFVPLNLYGKSKLIVDTWVRDVGYLKKVAGLRFFNVFGPNEYHKGTMRSAIAKNVTPAQETGKIQLFKSLHPKFADGEQKRDFIYIKDVVDTSLFFLENPVGGIFNVGTGLARSWNDLAHAIFHALGIQGEIVYIDMPENIKTQYQYFTEADISKLRSTGFEKPFRSLEDSVEDYVQKYLLSNRHLTLSYDEQ
jgi:ADP-L-glycero-D-manno-heptose 6-epimerase